VIILLAGAGAAVAVPLLWRRFVQTTNTQVHRINQ
jgi:hypothetical protein